MVLHTKAKSVSIILLLALLLVGVVVLGDGPTKDAQAADSRYGVIISNPSNAVVRHNLSMLGMSWWFDFTGSTANPSGFNKALLVRTPSESVKVRLTETQLRAMKRTADDGAYWIIGNEPNVGGQDDIPTSDYADLYKYYTDTIRSIDPTAKFVAANVLNWQDPPCKPDACSGGGGVSGQRWVSSFIDNYKNKNNQALPPVDVWGIHAYVIDWNCHLHNPPCESVAHGMTDYQSAIDQMKQMRDDLVSPPPLFPQLAGYRDTPIWITEYGVIWGYEGRESAPNNACSAGNDCVRPTGQYRADLIAAYMNGLLGWLNANADSKKIEKWFIYISSGSAEPYSSTYTGISLFQGSGSSDCLTQLGILYSQLAGGTPPSSGCPTPTPRPASGGGGGGGDTTAPTPTRAPTAVATATSTPAAGTTPTPTSTPEPTPPPVVREVEVARGGDVEHGGGLNQRGGVRLRIPPNAVRGRDKVSISISRVESPASAPEGRVVGVTIEVILRDAQGEIIRQLDAPVSIAFRPRAKDMEASGNTLRRFMAGRWEEDSKTWTPLNTSYDDQTEAVTASSDHLTKFAVLVTIPAPSVIGPADGVQVDNLAPLLTWSSPTGATQYHFQVIPANNDGPGIDLYVGDAALVAQGSYQVQAPKIGVGNYVMLPGMTYTWRVRTANAAQAVPLDSPGWSAWVSRTFRMASPSSASLSPLSPVNGAIVGSSSPTLVWSNSNESIFYYEVEVSKDPSFNTDPATAIAMVYWELRHGGATQPMNSYSIPPSFPLEPGLTYYWKVRPRVQGDGVPVSWSDTWSFNAPAP